MKSPSAPLTASVSRLAWVYTPAVRAAVDTFYFSALALVRPTTSSPRTLRCPRTFGRLRLPLRGSLCNIRRQKPSHLLGTPCRTEHRSESWAIPSLCRATPSATSEHLMELLGSSPIPRSFVASCVSFQLRLLSSTGVTRLHRSYEPLRHPKRPGLSLASCQLIVDPHRDHRWDFPCCAWSPLRTCCRQYPGRLDETCSLIRFHPLRPSLDYGRVGSCITRFGACSAFTHRYGLHARQVAIATLCTRGFSSLVASAAALICYRVERTSSRAGIPPLWTGAFHGAP